MKVVNAVWETRNLNRKTVEIEIEEKDNNEDFENINIGLDNQYIVVKISSSRPDFLHFLQKKAYSFVESQYTLVRKCNTELGKKYSKLVGKTTLKLVTSKEDIANLIENIGVDTFLTDRIATDPEFGVGVANARYQNWIEDAVNEQTADLYAIMFEEIKIGFVLCGHSDGQCINILLGGIFSEFQNMGLGYSLVLNPIEKFCFDRKARIRTKVSSNNFPVLRLYLDMGYQIADLHYILVKHKKADREV